MLKFERDGTLPDGEKTYRLVIDGVESAAGLTLDQVVRAINRRDEEKLGEEHGTKIPDGAPVERRRKADRRPGAKRWAF